MANRSMFDTPALPRLSTILEELREGMVLVPQFQREFLWNDEKRLTLMDSVYRGLPIGTLMVWRTRKLKDKESGPELQVRTYLGPAKLGRPSEESTSRTYLIDGLQRMSTLYIALNPPSPGGDVDPRPTNWPIYFDLDPLPDDRGDNRFKLLPRGRDQPLTWMPMSIVFDDVRVFELKDKLIKEGLPELTREVEQVSSRFKDYIVPVVPLATDDLEVVTETFARINRQGTTMGEADMTRALTYSKEFDINEKLEQIRAELAERGWGFLSRQQLLNILKAVWDLPIYGAKPSQIKKKLADEPGALDSLGGWLRDAFDLLEMFRIYGQSALPYLYQLAGLVRAAQRHGRATLIAAAPRLERWLFQTAYAEHFSGMTYAQLAEAFDHVEAMVTDAGVDPTPAGMQRDVRPLGRFRVGAVRSTLFALSMAREGDRVGGGGTVLLENFGRRGTINKLLPGEGAESTGLYVIAENDELARLRRILRDPTMVGVSAAYANLCQIFSEKKGAPSEPLAIGANDPLCRKHLFSEDALEALRSGSYDEFAAERQQVLQCIERRFVQQIGMNWLDNDEST